MQTKCKQEYRHIYFEMKNVYGIQWNIGFNNEKLYLRILTCLTVLWY